MHCMKEKKLFNSRRQKSATISNVYTTATKSGFLCLNISTESGILLATITIKWRIYNINVTFD